MFTYKNIDAVVNQATVIEATAGRTVYADYRRTMQGIGDAYGVPVHTVCGVFAALSPNADWIGNLRSCLTVVKAHTEGHPVEECTVTTYNHCRAKAWRIMDGKHFYSVYRGLKVRNFWRCLCEPNHPEAICIDGHMVNIALGEPRPMVKSGISTGQYRKLATMYKRVARDQGILPSHLQAMLWHTWRRLIGVGTHLHGETLFPVANQLGAFVHIDDIEPFFIGKREKFEPAEVDKQLLLGIGMCDNDTGQDNDE